MLTSNFIASTLLQRCNNDPSKVELLLSNPKYSSRAKLVECIRRSVHFTPSFKGENRLDSLLAEVPELSAEIALVKECVPKLLDVLDGTVAPLELLFKNDETGASLAERFYHNNVVADHFNDTVKGCVTQLLEKCPQDRIFRVLEIGAGTGGTTTAVLPALVGRKVEYVFTDLSDLFLRKAKSKFQADFPFVSYKVFDCGLDLENQGLYPQQFDVIIAANVLHATPDLNVTLGNVKKLLVPGGAVMMLELTLPSLWLDVTLV